MHCTEVLALCITLYDAFLFNTVQGPWWLLRMRTRAAVPESPRPTSLTGCSRYLVSRGRRRRKTADLGTQNSQHEAGKVVHCQCLDQTLCCICDVDLLKPDSDLRPACAAGLPQGRWRSTTAPTAIKRTRTTMSPRDDDPTGHGRITSRYNEPPAALGRM